MGGENPAAATGQAQNTPTYAGGKVYAPGTKLDAYGNAPAGAVGAQLTDVSSFDRYRPVSYQPWQGVGSQGDFQFKAKEIQQNPEIINTYTGGNDGGGTGYTGAVDSAGVPAPFLGVDPYDTEGDDNFLTQDETAEVEQTIGNQFDSIDTFDLTKTAEEQLTPEEYASWSQTDATADNYLPTSNEAVMAADTFYNNQQQIYGEPTGNNVGSLVTGNVTGLDQAGIDELQAADDDATWAGDSSPVSQLINQQTEDYANSGKVFDPNDPSTWADSPSSNSLTDTASNVVDSAKGLVSGGGDDGVGNFGKVGDVLGGIGDALGITDYAGEAEAQPVRQNEDSPSVVDTATNLVSGGGDDGVGNFGAVGDFFGGIGDALGITDYAGEAEAAAQAEAEAAAETARQAEAAAEAQRQAEAAAEAQRQADAENARIAAERQAEAARQAEAERQAAAEAERQRQAAAQAEAERQRIAAEEAAAAEAERQRIAAEEEAARIAAEEAANKSNITADGEIDWDSNQTANAQERLAAGEIDFVTYLNEIGYYNAANKGIDLGFQVGLQAEPTNTGYVAGDGPVHTTTGQHTVENEMDGATATTNFQQAKAAVNNNDDGGKSHEQIIAEHNALREAETDLIQSDLDDDEFWDAYEDDDDGGGGGSSNDTSTVICTALMEMGELDPIIWKYDLMYGEQYVSDTTYRGYHDWAIPMVPKVKARHWLYFPLAKVMAKAWAYQMAHFMSNGEHGKSSLLGKAICWFGEGYCTWRGKRIEAREEGGNYAQSKST